jgi:translation elongation factor EF-G
MKELNQIVTEKTALMINDGTIENMISERLESTIKDSIESAMRSYSDFGKAITEKIEASIQNAARKVEIPEYNQFIKQVVMDKFSQVLEENAVSHLAELIEKALPPISKEAKASHLMDRIREAWEGEAREHNKQEIEISVDENDSGEVLYVTFNHPEYNFYSVKATFYNFGRNGNTTWHIGYINEGGKAVTGRSSKGASIHRNSVTDLLFQYYAMGTEFEMDEEFESIDVGYDHQTDFR